jgi:hypothetical protein
MAMAGHAMMKDEVSQPQEKEDKSKAYKITLPAGSIAY